MEKKKETFLDDIDRAILEILKKDGRIQWRMVGEEIHMTGQAVGERIKRMTDAGIIRGYRCDYSLPEDDHKRIDFVTVMMKTNQHEQFLDVIRNSDGVIKAHRISGAGCYLLQVETHHPEALDRLLSEILPYANYLVNSVVKTIKG